MDSEIVRESCASFCRKIPPFQRLFAHHPRGPNGSTPGVSLTLHTATASVRSGHSAIAAQKHGSSTLGAFAGALGLVPLGKGSLEDLEKYVKSETTRWAKVITDAGLKASQ